VSPIAQLASHMQWQRTALEHRGSPGLAGWELVFRSRLRGSSGSQGPLSPLGEPKQTTCPRAEAPSTRSSNAAGFKHALANNSPRAQWLPRPCGMGIGLPEAAARLRGSCGSQGPVGPLSELEADHASSGGSAGDSNTLKPTFPRAIWRRHAAHRKWKATERNVRGSCRLVLSQ
jgi:hypothetical protein